MNFKETNLQGVWIIESIPNNDERGFFMRTYDKEAFKNHGLPTDWVQESRALSRNKKTIRGLHFLYPPRTEAKLISMLEGEAFWVFLDVRKNSPTLGHWGTVILRAQEHTALFFPRGFANGVCTLTDNCHVLYHMDNVYDDNTKGEIKWNDPELGIPWPVQDPSVISKRDQEAKSFSSFLDKSGGGILI